jgi:hypothetical protein
MQVSSLTNDQPNFPGDDFQAPVERRAAVTDAQVYDGVARAQLQPSGRTASAPCLCRPYRRLSPRERLGCRLDSHQQNRQDNWKAHGMPARQVTPRNWSQTRRLLESIDVSRTTRSRRKRPLHWQRIDEHCPSVERLIPIRRLLDPFAEASLDSVPGQQLGHPRHQGW